MDSRNSENSIKKYDEKSLEKLQSRAIFTDPAYLFVFKKTEKVIAALYLVTNLISDTEPIKWQIRRVSLGLMSDMLSLKRLSVVQSKQIITGLTVNITEIISLLKIASIADQVSSMNFAILQRELSLLMDSLQSVHPEIVSIGSLMLPQDFFNIPNIPAPTPSHFSPTNPAASYRTSIGQKDNQTQQQPKDNLKDNRRENILKLLKAGKPLGIKDFAREIKGCSEKTLQRELLAMVETGVLKKTGERRWSLYSLI